MGAQFRPLQFSLNGAQLSTVTVSLKGSASLKGGASERYSSLEREHHRYRTSYSYKHVDQHTRKRDRNLVRRNGIRFVRWNGIFPGKSFGSLLRTSSRMLARDGGKIDGASRTNKEKKFRVIERRVSATIRPDRDENRFSESQRDLVHGTRIRSRVATTLRNGRRKHLSPVRSQKRPKLRNLRMDYHPTSCTQLVGFVRNNSVQSKQQFAICTIYAHESILGKNGTTLSAGNSLRQVARGKANQTQSTLSKLVAKADHQGRKNGNRMSDRVAGRERFAHVGSRYSYR